jgi:hypothetical protein
MPEGEGRHLVEGQGQGQSFSSALVPLKMAIWWIKGPFDRPAPRKPRPEGRGQGELYKNGNLPYRGGFTLPRFSCISVLASG